MTDVRDPALPETAATDTPESATFAGYFREPTEVLWHPLASALAQRQGLLDSLRGLFNGPPAHVQLRLWCFLELCAQPQARLSRDDVNRLFHALLPEALDGVLKRLRDIHLLAWDATTQTYLLPAHSQQVHALLVPLAAHTVPEGDDMAELLAQVAGAQQLGLVDASRLQHLHAQLARLHDEFSEAIASGSEARLREAQPRFDRALTLVDRAGQALTALIRADHEDPRLEREARALGQAQARLLSMASQFTRALQQADRQRVTLGNTGLTSSDVRQWLARHPALHSLLGDALSLPVRPVMVSQHDLLDVAEGEFERDRPQAQGLDGLPPPAEAVRGTLDTLQMPAELGALLSKLQGWHRSSSAVPEPAQQAAQPPPPAVTERALSEAILGGRFAQSAYRLQLLPLVGDAQAQTLKGQTGDLARAPWAWDLQTGHHRPAEGEVALISQGTLTALPTPNPDTPPTA